MPIDTREPHHMGEVNIEMTEVNEQHFSSNP